jgi:hypothetical protein
MHHKIFKVPLCLDVFLNMIHQSKKIDSSISLQRSNLNFRYEGKIKLKTKLKLKQKILKIEVRKQYCPKLFIQSLFFYIYI